MIARADKQAARDTAPAPAPCWLLDLPPEVLRQVLEYLCPQSLQFAGAACAKLRRETAAPDLVRAAARGSDEFWAPLVCDEFARSKIDHLLPRTGPNVGPTIGGLRRYFSGTRRPRLFAHALFFYGTVRREGEVVATFGPADADQANTNIGQCKKHDLAKLDFSLDWKSPVVKQEYSDFSRTTIHFQSTLLKKGVTISVYVITDSGTYLFLETAMKENSMPSLIMMNARWLVSLKKKQNVMTTFLHDNLDKVALCFQVVNNHFTSFEDGTKDDGQQAGAVYLQVSPYFDPTHRGVVELH